MATRSRVTRLTPRVDGRTANRDLERAIRAAAEPYLERLRTPTGNLGEIGEGWQSTAWDLYDKIPELRAAAMITGRAMGQCRLVLARVAHENEPVPLDVGTVEEPGPDANHPAVRLLARFAGGMGGQTALLETVGEHLTVAGESVLVGKVDPTTADPADPFQRMQAYSSDQVRKQGRNIGIQVGESSQQTRTVNMDDGYTAIRVWRPHPRFSWRADSAAHASLSVLQQIALYDARIRATSVSRLSGAGLLVVDEDATLPVSTAVQEPGYDGTLDPFLMLLMDVMSMAMRDQDSAAARVPLMIRAKNPKEAIHHLSFETPFDDKILDLRAADLDRFATAVDMPAEVLKGVGSTTHWTGALITEEWKKSYLPELMGFICDALTSGWLNQALAAAGYGDRPNDVLVWYDDSSVRTRENTGPEAQAAYDRAEISADAYRRALGFNPGDAPTGDDLRIQLFKQLVLKQPALAGSLLPMILDGLPDDVVDALANTTVPTTTVEPGSGLPPEPGTQQEPLPSIIPGG